MKNARNKLIGKLNKIIRQYVAYKKYNNYMSDFTGKIEPLFEAAKQKNEKEFNKALTNNIRKQTGKKPTEEEYKLLCALKFPHHIVVGFNVLFNKGLTTSNLFMEPYIYSHFIEHSYKYILLKNLLDICNGGQYRDFPFSNGIKFPHQMIGEIGGIGKKDKAYIQECIKEFYNRGKYEIINRAARHADFYIRLKEFGGDNLYCFCGEKDVSEKEMDGLILKAIAFHEAIIRLREKYVKNGRIDTRIRLG